MNNEERKAIWLILFLSVCIILIPATGAILDINPMVTSLINVIVGGSFGYYYGRHC